MHVAILYSQYSANGKGQTISVQLSNILRQNTIHHELFENNWPENFSDFNFVCLIGGDGTFNYFVNKYPKNTTPLFLLPGGTGNDFYWNIYGRKSVTEQLQSIVDYALQKQYIKPKLIDVAFCKLDGAKTLYYLNSAGLGFDGEVLKKIKAIRWIGGHLGYLLTVIKVILKFREPEYEINHQGNIIKGKFTIINIANSPRTGGGFLISPKANSFDGELNLLYCYLPNIFARLGILSAVEKGKHIQHKKVIYTPINRLVIKSQQAVFSQLDGELIEASEYEIGLTDWKLMVLVQE